MSATRGERVYEIRRALGPDPRHEMPQREFAELLTRTAKDLGVGISYDSSTITRIEKNERKLQVDDITVIAAVDPLKRSREWLGWGDINPNVTPEQNERFALGMTEQARKYPPAPIEDPPEAPAPRGSRTEVTPIRKPVTGRRPRRDK